MKDESKPKCGLRTVSKMLFLVCNIEYIDLGYIGKSSFSQKLVCHHIIRSLLCHLSVCFQGRRGAAD